MKLKIIIFLLFFSTIACKTIATNNSKNKLYEILFQGQYGGESYNFYEIIVDEKDFRKVLSEELILNKVKKEDIKRSNFLYLSLGEKNTAGYGISVSNVEEFKEKIIVTISKMQPAPSSVLTQALTYPFCIVKINSKKIIEIKE